MAKNNGKVSEIKASDDAANLIRPAEGQPTIADFNDTIARNRALPMIRAAEIPAPPAAYKETDGEMRNQRLRRIAEEHSAEGVDALEAMSKIDLKKVLGERAPDPALAGVLANRLIEGQKALGRIARLYAFAKEMDEINRSDALVYLEDVNKRYAVAVDDDPGIAEDFAAMVKLFEARSTAIVEGIARYKAEKEAKKREAEAKGDEAKPAGG